MNALSTFLAATGGAFVAMAILAAVAGPLPARTLFACATLSAICWLGIAVLMGTME